MSGPISMTEWVERLYDVRMEPDKLLIMIENKRAELRRAPASAQVREEEALGQIAKIEQSHCYTQNGTPDWIALQDDLRKIGDIARAALRSRQSPQAVDEDVRELIEHCAALAVRYVEEEDGINWTQAQLGYLRNAIVNGDYSGLAAAPQPSPQGEDADWCDLMADEFTRISHLTENEEIKGLCDRAITNTKQHYPVMKQRDDFYARWTAEKARAEELEARLASAEQARDDWKCRYESLDAQGYEIARECDRLKAALASAQSSAQGEEAREIVAARDEEWKAWIKAKGFDLEPLAGCP